MNLPMNLELVDFETWKKLDDEIKAAIFKNGYFDTIKQEVEGELNEVVVKTSYGYETLFCGNKEACITVDVNGVEYHFAYVIDRIGFNEVLVNF